ncbi:MAG: hypothetical protein WD512_09890, partial [Candidatus Paceibacterota bacterium]
MAILNLDLPQAKKWLRRGQYTKNIILLLIVIGIGALALSQQILTIPLPSFIAIVPYLILLICARSLFNNQMLLIQGAFLEGLHLKKILIFFASLSCLMAVLIFNFRANLNLIYLVDGVAILLFSLTIRVKENLGQSAIYLYKQKFLEDKLRIIPLDKIADCLQAQSSHFLLMQLDSEYEHRQKKEYVYQQINQRLSERDFLVPLYPALYLMIVPIDTNLESFKRNLLLHFSTIIRNIIPLDPNRDTVGNLAEVVLRIKKTS